MDSTLTIRLDKKHREALRMRARTEQKTESKVARELLTAGLEQTSGWGDIKRFQGCIRLPKKTPNAWQEHIRRMNWRA